MIVPKFHPPSGWRSRLNKYLTVKVWSDFACFTNPAFKVERYSYPVMTPSAARNICEAFFWHPQFEYQILEIWVLQPIQYMPLMRSELAQKASTSQKPIIAEDNRVQRNSHILCNGGDTTLSDDNTLKNKVGYVIVADIVLHKDVAEHPEKYRDQFRRRVHHGQFQTLPYLGCSEFVAFADELNENEEPIDETRDLGRMLFDINYQGENRGEPIFFEAKLEGGIMRVDPKLYQKLRWWPSASATS